MRAVDFSNSIGVVTHSTYYDTAYGYNNQQNILPDLQYIGVTQIRDGLDVASTGGLIETLMAAGIKDDMVAGTWGNGVPAQTVSGYIAELETFEAAVPGGINSVEGFNEVSLANLPATEQFQSQLYAAIKADPKLAGISLYNYTGSSNEASFYKTLGNVSSSTDYGNTHSYASYFPPELWNSWYVPLGLGGTPNTPYVVTETGYETSKLPQDIAAKETLNDVFDLIKDGASKAYLYELLDEQPDPGNTNGEDHFGLFNIDGTPKQAATALHNLHAIIADTGATASTFTPGTLSYSVTGLNSAPVDRAALGAAFGYGIFQSYISTLPAYGNSLLLAKSNGTFDLAVWQEPMIYDGVNRIAAPLTPVTVTLGQVAASVEVFDPLIGTSPIATYTGVSQVTLQITDHPLIVEVDPFVDLTVPVVSSVTSAASSSSAHQGQVIAFTVTTSEAVAVSTAGGAPTLSLSTGGTATYDAAHSTATMLAFTTTVAAGQSSADLQLTGLALNGAAITDLAGNALTTSGLSLLAGANTNIAISTATPMMVLGSGADTLALTVSEDAYLGDAQFTVSVDGKQIGGTQTAVALRSAGASQEFDIKGAFGAGPHAVSVNFLNDAWAGTPNTDRNLYVTSASLNGQAIAGGTLNEMAGGAQQFSFGSAPTVPRIAGLAPASDTGWSVTDGITDSATPTIIGTGQAATTITLYDAGRAIGTGVATASGTWAITPQALLSGSHNLTATAAYPGGQASAASSVGIVTIELTVPVVSSIAAAASSAPAHQGQAITFVLATSEAVAVSTAGGAPTLSLSTGGAAAYDAVHSTATALAFTTTVAAGQSSADLQVTGLALNGAAITDLAGNALTTSGLSLLAGANTNIAISTAMPVMVLGSGPDTLALTVSEDAYLGDAQFTVSVDGKQISGTQTALALRSAGASQEFDVKGAFGAGTHAVSVSFLNDAWAGTPATDRNLYVTGASFDNVAAANGTLSLMSGGPQTLTVGRPVPVPTVVGSGADTIALQVSEDAYLGDAQFTVSVDGKQIGGTQTAVALRSTGASQEFDVKGAFGAGLHAVSVNFLNDAWAGTPVNPNTDRNLYVTGASFDNVAATNGTLSLMAGGPQSLTVGTPVQTPPAGNFITTGSGDVVRVGTTPDTVNAAGTSATVFGGTAALTFIGGSGSDNIYAGSGMVTITANSDILNFLGSNGAATINAGTGPENYNFVNGTAGGTLTVSNYNPALDKINLFNYAPGAATQTVVNGSTQIALSDNTKITLLGTSLSQPQSHFLNS